VDRGRRRTRGWAPLAATPQIECERESEANEPARTERGILGPPDQLRRVGGVGGEAVGDAVGADRLVALVADVAAVRALLLDVRHFAVRRDLAVTSRNATAGECRKS